MILESIFIIRGGDLGDDWTAKLFLAILGICFCIYDYRINANRMDYFWVFITGTITWCILEGIMQLLGVRQLQDKFLFGAFRKNIF